MENIFNKKLTLIFLVLLCSMHSFSVLKSARRRKKARQQSKQRNKNKPNHVRDVKHQNPGASSNDSEISPSSPRCLRNICSKLMGSLRTAQSFATRRAMLIAMMTMIATMYIGYHYSIPFLLSSTHDDYQRNSPELCSTEKVNILGIFLYNKICEFGVLLNPGSIDRFCYCHLKTIGLGDYWERISDAATRMCQDSAWCTALTSILPEAGIFWTLKEALKKLPKAF